MKESLKKYLVEFIGTFFLVFTIGTSLFGNTPTTIPALAIGLILMVMVYAGGYISGGHYNPAVSLAAAIRGALSWKHIAQYFIAQILGSVLAGFAVAYAVVVPPIEAMPNFNIPALLLGEFLFTFALCYVVLLTATSKNVEGNSYFGLAIGSTVSAGIFATSSFCLAAFNPAVVTGLLTMGVITVNIALITIGINLVAALAAGFIYKFVSCDRC